MAISSFLRLNVGFIIHETVGYSRKFDFNTPTLHLPPDLNLTNLAGEVTFSRTQEGLLAQAIFNARTEVECGRCLSPAVISLTTHFSELFVFPSHVREETDLTLPDTGIIDLSPMLREYLLLEIPINPVCRPDCRGLCPVCGENLNIVQCNHTQQSIDPRFSSLYSLLDD
jgi:uncharacterized protein